jgi:hypothetical protein
MKSPFRGLQVALMQERPGGRALYSRAKAVLILSAAVRFVDGNSTQAG